MPSSPRERRWATLAQTAEYTHCSTRTVRQRIADGDWPAYKPRGSRTWLLDLDEIDRVIRWLGTESLAAKIRRVLAEDDEGPPPDFSDETIREVARLLPRPRRAGDGDAA